MIETTHIVGSNDSPQTTVVNGELKQNQNQTLRRLPFHSKIELSEEVQDRLRKVVEAVRQLQGVTVEGIGSGIWVYGDTFPHANYLKKLGFHWAGEKRCWYFRDESCASHSKHTTPLEEIRQRFPNRIIKHGQKSLQKSV